MHDTNGGIKGKIFELVYFDRLNMTFIEIFDMLKNTKYLTVVN